MSLLTNGAFPAIKPHTSLKVSAEERINAVDFVNRVNLLFEEYDTEKLLDTFTSDGVAYHFHGTIKNREERRKFFEETYPYLIPGVSRHASNHIVDRDEETGGVIVRYHLHLVRYAWPGEQADKLKETSAYEVQTDGNLPQIWLFSPMIDRLKMTDDGYKIYERYVGSSVVNPKLDPAVQ
ncbi:hypothetical protein M409DRAFT_22572 [Zasmidium cellare ATCC 36951]|uniref:SnoaL-like domain-containing protein n=1 Tax=Zasmidium cellare ATCC 36951 TaxID=1080233 RepID=A0A6A6CJC1_ZASCE|nr:uncharacterized protein M409DRAFT_22572 [Zasmidium cellare ATCC 36951]KAF2167141.1 hypothetical protein M409DRAFT_22572 [Zasmidium cellare ATCC 36951]